MHFTVTYIILLNVFEPKITTATMKWRNIFFTALLYTGVKWQFMQQADERERARRFLCYCTFLLHWVVAGEPVGWATWAVVGHVFFFFGAPLQLLTVKRPDCRLQDVVLMFFRNQQRGNFELVNREKRLLVSVLYGLLAFSKSKKKGNYLKATSSLLQRQIDAYIIKAFLSVCLIKCTPVKVEKCWKNVGKVTQI